MLCDYTWRKCSQRDILFLITNDNKNIKTKMLLKDKTMNCNFSQQVNYNAHSKMCVKIKSCRRKRREQFYLLLL